MKSNSEWSAQNLKSIPIKKRLEMTPEFIQHLIKQANDLGMGVKRVYIYGSRARSDFRKNSDYDLAFEIENDTNWSRFIVDHVDLAETLLNIDAINIKDVDKSLANKIYSEGIVLYERS